GRLQLDRFGRSLDPFRRDGIFRLVQRRPAAKRLELFDQPRSLQSRIVEPVRRPHPNDFPALVVQDLLSQAIPVASALAAVIRGTVAFDSGQVALGKIRMADAEVDLVTRYADLVVDDIAARAEPIG